MFITNTFFKDFIMNACSEKISWTRIHNNIKHNVLFEEFHDCNYNKIKGDIFEMVAYYIFKMLGHETYLYKDIPSVIKRQLGLPDNDKGIDLIYKNDVGWIGIQCKWRKNIDNSLDYKYVDTFIRSIENSGLTYGIMFTNVKNITKNYNDIPNLKWFLRENLRREIDHRFYDIITNGKQEVKYKPVKVTKLRNYQIDAVNKLL